MILAVTTGKDFKPLSQLQIRAKKRPPSPVNYNEKSASTVSFQPKSSIRQAKANREK